MEQQPCLKYKRAVRDKHKFYRNSRTFRSLALRGLHSAPYQPPA